MQRILAHLPRLHLHVDGRTFLGGVLIASYMFLVNRLIDKGSPIPNAELVKDQLLVLGPMVGIIAGAIWRSTASEERRADALTGTVQTIAAAPTPLALPAPEPVRQAVEDGVVSGIDRAVPDAARVDDAIRTAINDAIRDGALGAPAPSPRPRAHETEIIE